MGAGLRLSSVKSWILGAAFGLCLAVFAGSLCACDTSDDTDFPRSVALAKKTNRPLLLGFLGTDWSISSLKLDREVFDQAEFADDAKYNFLLCKLHFYQTQERSPEIIRQNEQLAARYNVTEFPTVIVLSPAGEELGRIGYVPGGVEKFAAAVNKLILKGRASASRE
jgi:thioredoxin-related protein